MNEPPPIPISELLGTISFDISGAIGPPPLTKLSLHNNTDNQYNTLFYCPLYIDLTTLFKDTTKTSLTTLFKDTTNTSFWLGLLSDKLLMQNYIKNKIIKLLKKTAQFGKYKKYITSFEQTGNLHPILLKEINNYNYFMNNAYLILTKILINNKNAVVFYKKKPHYLYATSVESILQKKSLDSVQIKQEIERNKKLLDRFEYRAIENEKPDPALEKIIQDLQTEIRYKNIELKINPVIIPKCNPFSLQTLNKVEEEKKTEAENELNKAKAAAAKAAKAAKATDSQDDETIYNLRYTTSVKDIAQKKYDDILKQNNSKNNLLKTAEQRLANKKRTRDTLSNEIISARSIQYSRYYGMTMPNIKSLETKIENAKRDVDVEMAYIKFLKTATNPTAANPTAASPNICYNADFKYILKKICDNLETDELKKITKLFKNYLDDSSDGSNSRVLEILKNEQTRENDKTKEFFRIIAEVLTPLAYILDPDTSSDAKADAKDYATKKILYQSLLKFSEIDTRIDRYKWTMGSNIQQLIANFQSSSPNLLTLLSKEEGQYAQHITTIINKVIKELSNKKSNI